MGAEIRGMGVQLSSCPSLPLHPQQVVENSSRAQVERDTHTPALCVCVHSTAPLLDRHGQSCAVSGDGLCNIWGQSRGQCVTRVALSALALPPVFCLPHAARGPRRWTVDSGQWTADAAATQTRARAGRESAVVRWSRRVYRSSHHVGRPHGESYQRVGEWVQRCSRALGPAIRGVADCGRVANRGATFPENLLPAPHGTTRMKTNIRIYQRLGNSVGKLAAFWSRFAQTLYFTVASYRRPSLSPYSLERAAATHPR